VVVVVVVACWTSPRQPPSTTSPRTLHENRQPSLAHRTPRSIRNGCPVEARPHWALGQGDRRCRRRRPRQCACVPSRSVSPPARLPACHLGPGPGRIASPSTPAGSRTLADRPSIKTKLQVQVKPSEAATDDEKKSSEPHYNGTWDAVTKIASAEGVAGLYAGMSGSLLGVASTNFAYFYWYSIVRTLYLKYAKSTGQPSTVVELSLGAVAGALAQLFTIPVAVITTRQQTQSKEERKGIIDTAREVIEGEDGVTGLWRGLKASLVLVINPSITYGAYERLKDVLFPGKKNLSPWEAFGKTNFWATMNFFFVQD